MNGHNRPLIKPKKRLVSKLIPFSYKAIVQKSTDRVIMVSLKKQTNSLNKMVVQTQAILFLKSRVVLCRIRLFPTLISNIKWFGFGLSLDLTFDSLFMKIDLVLELFPSRKNLIKIKVSSSFTSVRDISLNTK